jgi:hypothetical protein
MLRDADLSLANWLKRVLPPDTAVRFDAPQADWERRGPGSAFVSAFLRTVTRDGQDLPRSGWTEARGQDGRVTGRQAAPRYYRLSYLITAWAAVAGRDDEAEASRRTLEEHELLGMLIDACTNAEILDQDQLTGSLAEAGIPCFVRCAGEDAGRPAADPWSGLGIAPHTHLELELMAPVVPRMDTELAPPARQIVLRAHQNPAPGRPGDADEDARAGAEEAGRVVVRSASATPPTPARTPGTVRRWERSTIVEPTGETSSSRTPRPDR